MLPEIARTWMTPVCRYFSIPRQSCRSLRPEQGRRDFMLRAEIALERPLAPTRTTASQPKKDVGQPRRTSITSLDSSTVSSS